MTNRCPIKLLEELVLEAEIVRVKLHSGLEKDHERIVVLLATPFQPTKVGVERDASDTTFHVQIFTTVIIQVIGGLQQSANKKNHPANIKP